MKLELEEKFEEYIEKIPDNYIYKKGDAVLYDMCHSVKKDEYNLYNFVSEMWLIGRSYAASPERKVKKYKQIFDYFEKFVEEAKSDEDAICSVIKNDNMDEYAYDFGDEDIKRLQNAFGKVVTLNEKIKKINGKINGKETDNIISFCSKILHFHFPDTIFITDKYSKTASGWLLNNLSRKNDNTVKGYRERLLNFESKKAEKFEEEICNWWRDKKADSPSCYDEYIRHIMRCYRLSVWVKKTIKDEGNFKISNYKSIPRFIDLILTNLYVSVIDTENNNRI